MKTYIKSIFFSVVLVVSGIMASAQTVHDALRFSREDIYGTARSMAMGNAFTAIGGDLGAVTVNPAATGIYRYSEFEISPGLDSYSGKVSYEGNTGTNSKTRVCLGSVGYVGYVPTRNTSGLKNVNWSISTNQTGGYVTRTSASGMNIPSSWLGAKSYEASVYNGGEGIDSDYLNYETGLNRYPWDLIAAYQACQINNYSEFRNLYIANTENLFLPQANLDQRYDRESYGYTHDINFNVAFNFSDKLFFGVNLTAQTIWYSDSERFYEQSINHTDFEEGFSYMTYRYDRTSRGVGFKAQLGLIYRPIAGLSIGAAISTPTWKRITDRWSQSIDAYSTAYKDETQYCDSPVGESKYSLKSPFRWNIGIGYTIGRTAMLSAEYSYLNYGNASITENGNSSGFSEVNNDIKVLLSTSHTVRAGAEIRFTPQFAFRLGYNLITSPTQNTLIPSGDDADKYFYSGDRHILSTGIGYRNDLLFIDLAFQQQLNNDIACLPYNDYLNIDEQSRLAPTVSETIHPWKLLLTLGFKF